MKTRGSMKTRTQVGHSVLLGLGVAILANSRPLEGMVVALPAAILLAVWAVGELRGKALGVVLRVALPAAAVLTICALGMLRYNQAVTGDAWRLPYVAWEEQYATVPNVSGRPLRVIDTPRPVMIERFYDRLAEQYDPARQWLGLRAAIDRLVRNGEFFWGLGLAVPALLALVAARDPRVRWAWLAVALLFSLQWLLRPWWPHYTAPAMLVLMAPAMVGLRRLWLGLLGSARAGQSLVAGIVAISLVMIGPQLIERLREQDGWAHTRAHIAQDLAATGPADIVFVRYGSAHHPAREWVFNAGDLAAAPVLWVRDLGVEANRELLAAFPEHAIWWLDVDVAGEDRPALSPYSPTVSVGSFTPEPVHSRARP
jgi:hypothetical protein